VLVSGYSYFEESPRRAVQMLAMEAGRRGVPLAIDAASVGFLEEVGPDRFREWTAGADLLFCNSDEAATLAGSEALEVQMRRLGETYRRVVVKRGALGAAAGSREGIA